MGKQEIGDLEVVRQGIEQWMQQRFSDRPGLSIGELQWPEASGESSVTLLLDASWPGGGSERFALRMVPPKSEVFETHDLLLQVQIMDIMRKEGVPVPPVVGYEGNAELLGSDFYVMRFVDGRIPPDNPPFVFVGWLKDDCSEADRAEMWDSVSRPLSHVIYH